MLGGFSRLLPPGTWLHFPAAPPLARAQPAPFCPPGCTWRPRGPPCCPPDLALGPRGLPRLPRCGVSKPPGSSRVPYGACSEPAAPPPRCHRVPRMPTDQLLNALRGFQQFEDPLFLTLRLGGARVLVADAGVWRSLCQVAGAASCPSGNPPAQRCGGSQQTLAPRLYVFQSVSVSSDFLGDEPGLSSSLRVDSLSLPQWVFILRIGREPFNIREPATCSSTPLEKWLPVPLTLTYGSK